MNFACGLRFRNNSQSDERRGIEANKLNATQTHTEKTAMQQKKIKKSINTATNEPAMIKKKKREVTTKHGD